MNVGMIDPFESDYGDAIAIVGMAGRFPGAKSVEEFWQNQRAGKISISHFTDEELEDWFDESMRKDENFVRARGILEGADEFDAELFGMYAREAKLTDPQHRIFLEVSLEALESAGLDPNRFTGPVGVFAGSSMPTYLIGQVMGGREDAMEFASNYQLGGMDTLVGSLPDALATRVSYKLDLHGPAFTVQSACSTSALAVAQACQSLLMFQCDAALAGGVSITFPQKRGYLYQDGGMGSRDGTCRPFDHDACGTVFGSGAAAVVLKRVEDAIRDKDEIIALIRGTGVANDGARKVAFTAPSAEGQSAAIATAIAEAAIDPATIGYVELHGTATPLGDPIEFDGLKRAFGPDCPPGGCVLGSAKANIGHLDAAAGVTGLIKAALCLNREEIPPLANYSAPNPHIELGDSPFRIERELSAWPRSDRPRRAGISSFGVGGTNVHIVLEEPPVIAHQAVSEAQQILPFSAKSGEALEAQAAALAAHLTDNPGLRLADIAYTLAKGRSEREQRGAVVAKSVAEAADKLATFAKRGIRAAATEAPPVVFMFPGQGSQYPGMGANLYRTEPVFREWIDRGAELLLDTLELDIRELLYGEEDQGEDTPHPIRSTVYAQPALFLTQYALAKLWMERGITPTAMIGHSVGELVAATISGVLSFEDGLALVARRAALMQSAEPGAMLAVRMSEEELTPLLGDGVDLAAVNAPALCVAAGPFDSIERLEERLKATGSEGRRLHTSHAFHSEMMEPVVTELEKLACGFTYGEPTIPYVSGVSGDWAAGEFAACGEYWARHCREPVRFAAALKTLVGDTRPLLIEVGAGRTLSTFAGQGLARGEYLAAIPSMPDFAEAGEDEARFAEALARVWCHGATPHWDHLYGEEARRIPLPSYQFQHKSYWIEQPPRGASETVAAAAEAATQTTAAPAPPPLAIQPSNDIPNNGAMPVADSPSRITRLSGELAQLLEDLSGETVGQDDWKVEFLELGFDSLFLGQVAAQLKKQFGVKVTFRQLMNDFPSIDALAQHLDGEMPPDAAPAPVAAAAPAADAAESPVIAEIPAVAAPMPAGQLLAAPAQSGELAATFQAQLQAMQSVIDRQLALLGAGPVPQAQPAAQISAPVAAPAPAAAAVEAPKPAATAPEMPLAEAEESGGRFKPFNAKAARDADPVSDEQRAFIADLTQRYCDKMPTSKAQTAKHRDYFSDPRSAAGFRPEWKEMVFPVVAAKSKGSKIWDVDGNEFVDLVNGYGQTAFGHAPDFVVDAVSKQLEEGFAIGPQAPLAGEVASRISQMVNLERVTFCNTGSEAVMAAMRVARCVSGKEKVVVFNNDYHGQFDEVLVKAGGKAAFARALPIAPGIPGDSVANMVVLPYGSAESLEWIRNNTDDIAAVIVEPVQSRHPELLPFDFLRDLRTITKADEIALVFDEVVTGFRTHRGGMQAVLGIEADMACYGKVIGGGMPIGILAGASQFMDALDGGSWKFGDDSIPEVAPTFFAGTFVRHPLVLAACNAVLDFLDEQGPDLQTNLAARTKGLVERINSEFESRDVPVRAPTYSSWFMLDTAAADRLGPLFNYHMRLKGVHILDAYPCFMTTAHSDADLDHIVNTVGETLDTLQRVGIFAPSGKAGSATAAPAAPTEAREAPLTEPQLEILLSAQMGPEASCAYNESFSLDFDGKVDSAALAGAINDFIARHEAIRGTIKPGEQPALIIAPALSIEVPVVANADADDLARIKAEEAVTPFDLVRGPLLRAQLVELVDGTATLVTTAHHIVFDGWTANIFAEEVAAFYRQRTGGGDAILDPVESFADYALAQTSGSAGAAADLEYWRKVYETLPEPLELPGDRARPAVKSFAGASYVDSIDADLTKAVKSAGAKLGCTLFATLFGAFQATIGRLAGSDDVVLGCPVAGQADVEDKVLAGHCVNFLPLRAPFGRATPIGDHLKAVKTSVLEAFDHGTATYGSIVRALGLPRDPNRTPLTDIQFNLERVGEAIDFGSVSADLKANAKAAVNFDLFFNAVESSEGLRLEIDYSSDLFDESTIARWVENYRQVLRALVADPSVKIGELDILGDEERAWLAERNPAWPVLSNESTIVKLFEKAVAAHPDNTAVVGEGRKLAYRELETASNRLAHFLRDRAVGKGDRVALIAGRSVDTVVAILGILKSGACFIPLDPAYPASRLAFMLEESDPALVLYGPDGETVAAGLGLAQKAMPFDQAFAQAEGMSEAALPSVNSPDDPAYVMYTSGSTGQPKGVVAPHRAVVRLVVDQDYAQFGPEEVFLHIAPLAFDASTLEIWGPLLHGGTISLISEPRPALADIERAICDTGVTTVWSTTALFNAIVDEKPEALASVKRVMTGGDVVSTRHFATLREALPEIEIVHAYGPTENTTFSTCYRVPKDGWGEGTVPIGGPIAHSSAFVLDDRLQLRPQHAVGELYVGGEGLALGYLGQPRLTAQKFVANPFAPGELLYRTGDLVRWRRDGTLEFVGRADNQVKINGHRVEPGEIESVLRTVDGIVDAAVIVAATASGSKQLHAFVSRQQDDRTDEVLVAAANAKVATDLPAAMQLRSIRIVPALPSNANGKVDRAALQRELEGISADAAPVAQAPSPSEPQPLTELESKIAAVWCDVLELPSIAKNDAIFDLGADSLQIFRIAARMTSQGLELDNRRLLTNPTLAEVAEMLDGAHGRADQPAMPKIAPLSAYRRDALQDVGT